MTEEEERERFRYLELKRKRSAAPEPEAEGPGLYDRTVQRVSDAMSAVAGDIYTEEGEKTRQSVPDRLLKAVGGELIPAAGDVMGTAIVEGGKAVLPKDAERAIAETAADVSTAVTGSAPVQAGLEKWREFEKASPETAERVAELANVASVAGPVALRGLHKAVGRKVGGPDPMGRFRAGEARRTRADIQKDIEPQDLSKAPGKVRESGPFRRTTYDPTDAEMRVGDELAQIEGYDPRRGTAWKVNKIESEVDKMRLELDESLKGAELIDVDDIQKQLKAVRKELKASPTMTGSAGQSAGKVMKKFNKLLEKYSDDGLIDTGDLLQARRDLDVWLKANAPTVFGSETSSATKLAAGRLRREINDIVGDAVPDAQVATSLQKQADLLTARDEMLPRLRGESKTGPGRLVKGAEQDFGGAPPRSPLAFSATITNPLAVAVATTATAASAGTRAAGRAARLGKARARQALQQAIEKGATPAEIAALQAALEEEEEL